MALLHERTVCVIFSKRRRKDKPEVEISGSQDVVVTWGNKDQQEIVLHASLFQVAAQLTQIRHPDGGKTNQEIVETFTGIYELLDDWYRGTTMKAEIKRALDTLIPDPPGFVPGQTVLARSQSAPPQGEY